MQTDTQERLIQKQAKLIEVLIWALELILEVHPERNDHETYVLGVRDIATKALKKVRA